MVFILSQKNVSYQGMITLSDQSLSFAMQIGESKQHDCITVSMDIYIELQSKS